MKKLDDLTLTQQFAVATDQLGLLGHRLCAAGADVDVVCGAMIDLATYELAETCGVAATVDVLWAVIADLQRRQPDNIADSEAAGHG